MDGVIDLERLRSGPVNSLERNAQKFFDLTYPTEDVHAVLRGLIRRFGNETAPGTVLAQSVKGLGKSHTLLLGYHLFKNPDQARAWTETLGLKWSPPADTEIIVQKFTDQSMPDDALWLLIGQQLGTEWSKDRPPNLDEFRAAMGDKHLVIILDELERGITNISDTARRSQNISFLQMLSEEAGRDEKVTLFAAIYDGNKEPGSTLKRTPRIELRFRKAEDRAAIVRHRLFSDAESYDRDAARSLIRSYINTWKRFDVETPDAYTERMEATFPFLPDLIDLVFERITESGGFQGTRSALGLLGAMLDVSGEGSFLMTAANCQLTDRACADRLQDLDPAGTLINCAISNHRDLENQPCAEGTASAVLLSSLVPGVRIGLSRDELVRHVAMPGTDPNQFHTGLDAFKKFGTYFHEREGRFFFDLEENEYAKVELDAIKYNDEMARDQIIQIWRQEIFRDTHQSVVFQDIERTKAALQDLPKQSPRYILSPRRLSLDERHALYQGMQLRNQILLLEPKNNRVDHLVNPDLIALAKRLKSARQLADSASNTERRGRFERIEREQTQHIQRILKSAGLVYVRIDQWADRPEQTQFEEESLGQASSKEQVQDFLRTQIFPPSLFQEHIRERLQTLIGQRIEQVDRAYRNTLGYPVPLSTAMVSSAIRGLVEDGGRILGLQHPRAGGGFCGERVTLSESELNQAVLTHAWAANAELPFPPVTPGGVVAPPEMTGEDETVVTGGAGGPAAIAQPTVSTDEWATPYCRSLSELRQQVAARLNDVEDAVIRFASFTIFASYKGQDLSALPAAYRGALTGQGDLDLQLDITVPGPMSKADLEQQCEKLPNLAGSTYAARVNVETPMPSRQEEDDSP
ncbi:MAG: hypothetical protein ACE5GZ_01135 [Gammaproteobacteria bacterium]